MSYRLAQPAAARSSQSRGSMSTNKENAMIRIELTPEQSEQIKAETGRSVTTLDLTVQELETRVAPYYRLALNHNETLLVG